VFDVAMPLLRLYRVLLSLFLHLCRIGFLSFPCLSFLLLYTLLSLCILSFSFFGHLQCLLLGFSTVSVSGNILQSYSLDLAFFLTDLYPDSLPTLPVINIAKLLACTATRPRAIAVHVGV
jgi:hypothetical protein